MTGGHFITGEYNSFYQYNSSITTICGSAVVKASGGAKDEFMDYGTGAAIGKGGTYDSNNLVACNGDFISPDTTRLDPSGCVLFYIPGTSAQDMINHPTLNTDETHDTIIGTYIPPVNNPTANIVTSRTNDDASSDSNKDSENTTPAYTGITTVCC